MNKAQRRPEENGSVENVTDVCLSTAGQYQRFIDVTKYTVITPLAALVRCLQQQQQQQQHHRQRVCRESILSDSVYYPFSIVHHGMINVNKKPGLEHCIATAYSTGGVIRVPIIIERYEKLILLFAAIELLLLLC